MSCFLNLISKYLEASAQMVGCACIRNEGWIVHRKSYIAVNLENQK